MRRDRFKKALNTIRLHSGPLTTAEILRAGIHPSTLYSLRDSGRIERISRGRYRMVTRGTMKHPDLLPVALRVSKGVLCLLSALSYHNLTTQIPHEVQIALPPGARTPVLEHPPIQVFRFREPAYSAGIESHEVGGAMIRVYCVEKTIADCFKFRNKIGMDTVLEALRFYRERRKFNVDGLMKYAAICRVTNVIRPYLEAVV